MKKIKIIETISNKWFFVVSLLLGVILVSFAGSLVPEVDYALLVDASTYQWYMLLSLFSLASMALSMISLGSIFTYKWGVKYD